MGRTNRGHYRALCPWAALGRAAFGLAGLQRSLPVCGRARPGLCAAQLAGAAGGTRPARAHPGGSAVNRASRGLWHPGLAESLLCSQQHAGLWSTASSQGFLCLVPFVNKWPRSPGHVCELRFVFHAWFCCAVLLLLLEMNSCLLSLSPFHKKSMVQRELIFFFFHEQRFVFMMLQQHFLRLKPADCPV